MADNTARAKAQLDGHRKAVREHIEKWRRYTEPYDKQFALKTIAIAQGHIAKLKNDHPSLNQAATEDSWKP